MYCGEVMHWGLIFFELLAPYAICLLLLPMIVRARVKYVYEITKKQDVEMKPVKSKQVDP